MNNVIIGIPAYNAEETLPTLLASIKTQTYKDYKVVIVADGDNKESLYDTIASSFVDNYEVVSLYLCLMPNSLFPSNLVFPPLFF